MTKYNESEQFIAELVADHPADCARMVEAMARYGITRTPEQVAEAWNESCENYVSAAWLSIFEIENYVARLLATELDWADGEVARLTDEAGAANARVEVLLAAVHEIAEIMQRPFWGALDIHQVIDRVIGSQ